MIFAKKIEEDGTIECLEPDYENQINCEFYQPHRLVKNDAFFTWCKHNYDEFGELFDQCMCPAVLAELKQKEKK